MKKIIALIMCCAVMMALGTSTVFAEETEAEIQLPDAGIVEDDSILEGTPPTEETPSDGVTAPDEDTITEIGEQVYNTLFTRVFEFFEVHKDTIIMVCGFFASILIYVRDMRKRTKGDKQSQILLGVDSVTKSQNGVVDVINNLIVGYDEMKKKYAEYEGVEDDRNKLVGAVLVQNAAILDILSIVYPNSKLPQGAKDMVQLTYARCQSALDDDEKLKACVRAVRDAIGEKAEEETDEKAVNP